MINFKFLRWKNLLSTGNNFTEINLSKSKTTLIVGENGAGKSTILDALSFSLYGKPFRKINKYQLANTINNKNVVAEVEFDIGRNSYKVVRGMKPNVFEIYQNGTLLNQNAEMKEYQEIFEKQILKMNHKSFSQVVILGSASFTPFMQLPAAHRREVIEDLLDIQIFSTMNSLLKTKIQQNKEDLAKSEMMIQLANQKITLHRQNIETLKQNNDELIEGYYRKIDTNRKSIEEQSLFVQALVAATEDLKEKITDQSKVHNKSKKLDTIEFQIKEKRKSLEKEISFFHDNDNCPTCKQELQVEHKNERLAERSSQLNSLEETFQRFKQERADCDVRLDEIIKVSAEITKKNNKISEIKHSINICNATINSLENNIKSIESQSKKIGEDSSKLEEIQNELSLSIQEKNKYAELRSLHDIAANLLKDTGIKTKIIKQYIPVMNKLINKYLAAMDFFVEFELNESFEEKIKSRYRDEFSYDSFSEGEKLRIDLALLFTWRAISKLRNSASTNLLIMDEIFDSSLDNAGTEEFLKILETLTSDTNVFIISHKTDNLYDKFHSVIRFEKTKNFSRIAA
jgi:DNA repair exonuclease SbcCD ATPase subunit